MREIIRYGFILALICVVAAGLLAGVYSLTQPKILAQAQAEEQVSLKEVIPEGEEFEPIKKGEEIICYKAYDKAGKLIGTAFKAFGKGYSSVVEVMVGMLNDGNISAIKILSQNETPGLGAKIIEPEFTNQFKNKSSEDLNEVEAITGATISSKAVINAVAKRAEEIKGIIQNER
jgi:electron transport complex protein RnfG